MPYLINYDEMSKAAITDAQAKTLRRTIRNGKIFDAFGDIVNMDDVEDRDGNICLDDDAYQQARLLIQD